MRISCGCLTTAIVVGVFLVLLQGTLNLLDEHFHEHRPVACQVATPTLADFEADVGPSLDDDIRRILLSGPDEIRSEEKVLDGYVLSSPPTTRGEEMQRSLQDLAVCRSRSSNNAVDDAKYRQNIVQVNSLFRQYVEQQIQGDAVPESTVQVYLALTTPSPDEPPPNPSPTTWNPKTYSPGRARSGK